MAASRQIDTFPILEAVNSNRAILARERKKSLMLRAWILSGLFFMALPGTLLGFSNLMAISTNHGLGSLPAAWMEGHGHAQMFGWIGSFILGIGFYSQPARERSALRIPVTCFVLWTLGVAMRWSANIYGWHWRSLFPISAGFELIAVLLFLVAASHHKRPGSAESRDAKPRMELWMISVLLGTAGLAAAVIFNFVECLLLAIHGTLLAFPHALDQKYLILLGWGFLVPVVWGFSARWLPAFLAIAQPVARLFSAALALDLAGVLCGAAGWAKPATILLASSAIVIGFALHLTQRPHGHAKVLGIHPSFPSFIRMAYAWLVIAGCMSLWAAFADQHGGIWGASRHALTVGFAATMVFTIGPRILPHFGGVQGIFSKRLMFLSLLLLQSGCTLRVSSEPLAYEGLTSFAWKVLPVSGMLELSGVLIFAINLALTFLLGRSMFAQDSHSRRVAA
ncbi:MAG: hypothetical protein P4K86_05570 [Terracidiphilus sp.]|nr:hypothetical protein [Terracidiphilus sp.]MDR3775665.1 hypothetical protein [Terracidiphilus sp.]